MFKWALSWKRLYHCCHCCIFWLVQCELQHSYAMWALHGFIFSLRHLSSPCSGPQRLQCCFCDWGHGVSRADTGAGNVTQTFITAVLCGDSGTPELWSHRGVVLTPPRAQAITEHTYLSHVQLLSTADFKTGEKNEHQGPEGSAKSWDEEKEKPQDTWGLYISRLKLWRSFPSSDVVNNCDCVPVLCLTTHLRTTCLYQISTDDVLEICDLPLNLSDPI